MTVPSSRAAHTYTLEEHFKFCLAAELHYASLGLATFPISRGFDFEKQIPLGEGHGKKPDGKIVPHGVKDATTNTDRIKKQRARNPGNNIGIATGSAYGIFAIGPDGDQGISDLAKLELVIGKLPITAKARSGGGGIHLLFRMPKERFIANAANHKGLAIDVRGEGGYIVAAPSIHGITGCRYEWIDSLETTPIANAPLALLEWVEKPIKSHSLSGATGELSGVHGTSVFGSRPGDDFNRRASWSDILEPAGWSIDSGSRSGKIDWTRPGKNSGVSATTGYCNSDLSGDMLYVFTPNAPPFEANKSYSKFSAHVLLNHGGDYGAATKEIAEKGYGNKQSAWFFPCPDIDNITASELNAICESVFGVLPDHEATAKRKAITDAYTSEVVASLPDPGFRAADCHPRTAPADTDATNKATACDCEPTLCPTPHNIAMRHATNCASAVLLVDCKKIVCPHCGSIKKRQVTDTITCHLTDYASDNGESATLFTFTCNDQSWHAVYNYLNRWGARADNDTGQPLQFMRLKLGNGTSQIVSTESPRPGTCIGVSSRTPAAAAAWLNATIATYPLTARFYFPSRGWELISESIRRDTGWRRLHKLSANYTETCAILEQLHIDWQPKIVQGTYWRRASLIFTDAQCRAAGVTWEHVFNCIDARDATPAPMLSDEDIATAFGGARADNDEFAESVDAGSRDRPTFAGPWLDW